MGKSETQLAEDRMASVERQIHQKVPNGVTRRILCPYCGHWNQRSYGKMLCCDLLRDAIIAVLLGDRMLETAEAGERELNGHASA